MVMMMVMVCSGYLKNKEFCYDMNHHRRGKLIVISNRDFLPQSRMFGKPRRGTEHDERNLQLTFEGLGFDCEVHQNKTRSEMLNIFIDGIRLLLRYFMLYFLLYLSDGSRHLKSGKLTGDVHSVLSS